MLTITLSILIIAKANILLIVLVETFGKSIRIKDQSWMKEFHQRGLNKN